MAMINGHGDDIYKYQDKILINFSSNIYAKQDMSALHEFLCTQIHKIHSYPEPDAHSLAKLLANKYQISTENIAVTNGATEAIYLLAQTFRGSKTAIVIPTFSEYEDACWINKHHLKYYQRLEEIKKEVEMVWLCNPNNPNGKIYDMDYLKTIVRKYPDTLFVFDQSYASFINIPVWDIKEAADNKNIILLHLMTKQYNIPGLRLGYISAHASVMERVDAYRMPWSVNTLAVESGKYCIENNFNNIHCENYLPESKKLQNELNQIQGLSVISSPMHYFLCRLESKKASDLKQWLIENHNLLIRDASNFRGLDEHYFRIATQSPTENEQLVKAIKEWI